jgi:hypothetical protein
VTQSFSGVFQLLTELFFIQGSANGHWQLSEMLSIDAIESTVSSELRDGFISQGAGHEDNGNLRLSLMKESQSLRSFPTRAGVLGHDDIKRLDAELFGTLR